MKFIPFIDKTKAVDFTAATTLARRLNDDFDDEDISKMK